MSAESYLVGFIGFTAYVIAFLLFLRLPIKFGWFLLEILLGFIFNIICTFAGYLIVDQFSYWYEASLYFFLWFCFFFVTSIYSVSVSIGIIEYLYDQPEQAASIKEIYQNCVVKDFEKRAEFLVATKQVQKTDEGYQITPKGRMTAHRLLKINQILGMEVNPYYSPTSTSLKNSTSYFDQ
jgi:hypothetical protein